MIVGAFPHFVPLGLERVGDVHAYHIIQCGTMKFQERIHVDNHDTVQPASQQDYLTLAENRNANKGSQVSAAQLA